MLDYFADGDELSTVLTGSHAFVQLVALRVCVLLVVVVVASSTTVWIPRQELLQHVVREDYSFLWGVCRCLLSLWR